MLNAIAFNCNNCMYIVCTGPGVVETNDVAVTFSLFMVMSDSMILRTCFNLHKGDSCLFGLSFELPLIALHCTQSLLYFDTTGSHFFDL